MSNLIITRGKVIYGDNYKLYIELDNDISKFYLSLIPKYIASPNPQKYDAHITVVRNETPINLKNWGKYKDDNIEFFYSPNIQTDGVYFWLNVYSSFLKYIRNDLGLPETSELSRPPSGENCFHITIGNLK